MRHIIPARLKVASVTITLKTLKNVSVMVSLITDKSYIVTLVCDMLYMSLL